MPHYRYYKVLPNTLDALMPSSASDGCSNHHLQPTNGIYPYILQIIAKDNYCLLKLQ